MKNLIVIVFLLITSVLFSQSILSDRIDYTKFDRKLFDSLMLGEINSRRVEMKLPPFIFDSICHQTANYQSKVMVKKNNSIQVNNIELDGVLLKTPIDRFEYFNMVNQVLNNDIKNLDAECVTGIRVGKESKTFTYPRLVKFVLDNFMSPEIDNLLYREYGTMEIFSAFSVELGPSEYVYNIFITSVIASK